MIVSITVVKENKIYKVFAYNSNGKISILFENKSEDKADDFADNYAIENDMYYSREENVYYKNSAFSCQKAISMIK